MFLGRSLAALIVALFVALPAWADDFPVPHRALIEQTVVPDSALISDIDRRALLRDLFASVTAGAATDQERIVRFVEYVQRQIFHPLLPPIDRDGTAVYDPLWILENRLGQCGQTNRLLVDAFLIAGYDARLVQLNGHVAAEAFFDGTWHYFDADAINIIIRDRNGRIPSALQVFENPQIVAGLYANTEVRTYPAEVLKARGLTPDMIGRYPYLKVFEPWTDPASGLAIPFAYLKTAGPERERNKYFGWNHYRAVSIR